ncbi:hypothetical protein Nepgr_019689 [Nepenthes gracilis]|uniref:Uncharacterized protein n=1 Tax=Nepenthes gracilis TaxID=150966 RepID=A0AAD3XUM3_NEPGR|nr:hypothetical protein Nepgr_019689 [Nepenthes gracilis]
MMATFSGSLSNYSVLARPERPLLSIQIQKHKGVKSRNLAAIQCQSHLMSSTNTRCLFVKSLRSNLATFASRNYNELKFDDEYEADPFWVNLFKEFIRAFKTLFVFLAEQPSQLKYIEWPSFQSTLKTATLTLVLVALLIVTLSSVDAALLIY